MHTFRGKPHIFLVLYLLLNIVILYSCSPINNDYKVFYNYQLQKIRDFDPAKVKDVYTHNVISNIFETLYQYIYLSDEYAIEPLIAAHMPVFSDNNMTVTIKLREDAFFYDSERKIFEKGKGRQVTAYDFEYSIKRLADPKVNSEGWWLFDGYLKGLNEWRAEAEYTGEADYLRKIEGIAAIDNLTLRFKLTKPYPQIVWALTMPFTMPVIKEAIEKYGKDWINHPIGTGPFYLNMEETIKDKEYVLDKNPAWRKELYPTRGGENAKKLGYLNDAGKRLPLVDRVVYYIVEDAAVLWGKFANGEIDISYIPTDFYQQTVNPEHELTKELKDKGVQLHISPTIDVVYYFFNFDDPVLGKNVRLRQAMSMAFDRDQLIEKLYNERAIPAQTLIPPGLAGYDPQYTNPYGIYNIEKAKKIVAEEGYPEGKGLPEFHHITLSSSGERQAAEIFKQNMAQIGIKIVNKFVDWPMYNDLINKGKVQIGSLSWLADYPDAQNFLQLLYGSNRVPGSNVSNYNDSKFNELYERSSILLDSPVRSKLYAEAAQYLAEQCPWILIAHRLAFVVRHKWLKNFMFKAIGSGWAKYYNIDLKQKTRFRQK